MDEIVKLIKNGKFLWFEQAPEKKEFSISEISSSNWMDTYHNWVNTLKKVPAVYIFCINNYTEIIYIGMAGKINRHGNVSNWNITNRLKAFRGKSVQGVNILTHDFIQQISVNGKLNIPAYKDIKFENIVDFNIIVGYPKSNFPAAFVESNLIFEFFQKKHNLPKLNLAF